MKKIRVRDLGNWPPDPGGPNPGGRYKVPASGQARASKVVPRQKDLWVTFVGTYEAFEHTYDYEASSEKIAVKLRQLIGENLGKSVFEIGDLEIEID
jgi:hypothetical protein